jgi:hypothetical protein
LDVQTEPRRQNTGARARLTTPGIDGTSCLHPPTRLR